MRRVVIQTNQVGSLKDSHVLMLLLFFFLPVFIFLLHFLSKIIAKLKLLQLNSKNLMQPFSRNHSYFSLHKK